MVDSMIGRGDRRMGMLTVATSLLAIVIAAFSGGCSTAAPTFDASFNLGPGGKALMAVQTHHTERLTLRAPSDGSLYIELKDNAGRVLESFHLGARSTYQRSFNELHADVRYLTIHRSMTDDACTVVFVATGRGNSNAVSLDLSRSGVIMSDAIPSAPAAAESPATAPAAEVPADIALPADTADPEPAEEDAPIDIDVLSPDGA